MANPTHPHTFSRRHLLGAGLALAGSAAVLQALGGRAAQAASSGGRVAVVGDSLTVGTKPYQAAALLAAGWVEAVVDGSGSRGIATKVDGDPHTGLGAVDAIRSSGAEPDLWIVALGTNDAWIYPSARYGEMVAAMLDRIGATPVLWVNVYLPAAPTRQQAWNAALTDAAAARSNVSVHDWASLAAQHSGWLTSDHVHYTGTGYQARAAAIAEASTTRTVRAPVLARVESAPVPLVAAGATGGFVGRSDAARALDTRTGTALAAGQVHVVELGDLVPAAATAVALNVTAIRPRADAYVTVWDATAAQPGTSNLNASAGATVAALALCPCTAGRVTVVASAATDLAIDVFGSFVAGDGWTLRTADARRLHDSRSGSAHTSGSTAVVTVPSSGGVAPRAALLGLIATDASSDGYLTVHPADRAAPGTSNLNFASGQRAVTNTALVTLDGDGRAAVRVTGDAHLVVDLLGVFDDDPSGLRYQPAEPARVLDTRSGLGGWSGALTAGETIDVAVPGAGPVLAANVTALPATADGYLTCWSGSGTLPATSTLNLSPDETRSVCSFAPTGDGGVRLTATGGSAAVLLDVVGWFAEA